MEYSEISVENTIYNELQITKQAVLGLRWPDEIYPRLLIEARKEIAGALLKIFASSLASDNILESCQ